MITHKVIQFALGFWRQVNSNSNVWATFSFSFPEQYCRVTIGSILSDGTKEKAIATYNFYDSNNEIHHSTDVHV